jgi:predicted XRE-type DNA-binding protein
MVDMTQFKKDLKKDLEAGRKAFEGQYSAEINELMGLSRSEIDAIMPGAEDLQKYDQLITVVKQASQHNISQAQLAENIRALGGIAVSIAKKCGSLAALFA